MKKTLFACAASISITIGYAQDEKSIAVAPPPPPPPPAALLAIAPPPPPPPPAITLSTPATAPEAPVADVISEQFSPEKVISQAIINENGYEIIVKHHNGDPLIFVTKDGKTQKIKMSTWMANRKYYEKKFGQLPPPPPPPPAPLPPAPPVPPAQ